MFLNMIVESINAAFELIETAIRKFNNISLHHPKIFLVTSFARIEVFDHNFT